MSKLRLIIENEVYCRFEGLRSEHVSYLDKKLEVEVPGARFTIEFKLKRWDGKKHFFNPKTCRTFHRLLDQVLEDLIRFGYDIELIDQRVERNPAPAERARADLFADRGFIFRPYQVDAINAMLDAGNGIVKAATGAGKTSICAGLAHIMGHAGYRTIIIVPSVDLIQQTHATLSGLGLDVGWYSGSIKDNTHTHLVSSWQSLNNQKLIMKDYQVVIVDETHLGAADSIQQIINEAGSHIQFRFGVTGTIPKNPAIRQALFASIGPVIFEISAKELMDAGYLSTLEIYPMQIKLDGDFPDYSAEKAFLARNEDSLDFLAEFIKEKAKEHGNTLVLVNAIQLGKKLARRFDDVELLYGETENELRREQYDKLNSSDGHVVIATSGIASTGIDVPRIHCGILIFPGKSFVKAIQSIGRMIRKAHDKDHAYVYDIAATLKYSRKHQRERLKYYGEEQYHTHPVQRIIL